MQVKLLLMQKLSGWPGTFLLPGADYSPGSDLNSTAAILAVVQHLLSYNTCRRFQLLRSKNSFWLLHLSGIFALAGSKSRGMLLLTGNLIFASVINQFILLTLLLLLTGAFTVVSLLFRVKKWKPLLFLLKSDKSLPVLIGKVKLILQCYWPGNK